MRISFILVIFLILALLIIIRVLTYPNFFSQTEFPEFYKQGDVATIETYDKDYRLEIIQGRDFPGKRAVKAKLFSGLFKQDKSLDRDQVDKLLKVVNDSSSYVWGEIGSFISGKTLLFYSAENEIVGQIDIDDDGGQTYSYPYVKRSKWGYLSKNANLKLQKILKNRPQEK